MDLKAVEINDRFAEALARMEAGGAPLFVTGKAGTGKSTLLEYFRATTKRRIVVLAPTGVAAVNVAGQTIHSFFGFRPDITVEKAERAARKVASSGARAKLFRRIETLVIDEVSMVRADLFDCVDRFLRVVRGSQREPFGGVHLVLIGDLYQLPPVVTQREAEIFAGHYRSPYFFDAHACEQMELSILELEKVYRQRDERFIAVLNAIRNNSAGEEEIAILNQRCDAKLEAEGGERIHLTSLNREADAINERKLAALRGKARRFVAEASGDFDRKAFPADEEISLKVGAQVMLLSNDPFGRWVNGTIGQVTAMRGDGIEVRLPDGTTEDVETYTWQMFHFELDAKAAAIVSKPVGTFTQLPVALAWAVTIHKSQGKTFDRAVIDIGRAFACGQVYVALSRVRTLDGIVLRTKLRAGHVRVDRRIVKYLTGHHYALSERRLPLEEKIGMIEEAIARKAKIEGSQ
jgi:ATP-dependent DNA helicase PIF1